MLYDSQAQQVDSYCYLAGCLLPTITVTPTATPVLIATHTPTPTSSPTPTGVFIPTATQTATSVLPTPTATLPTTPTATNTPTVTPTATMTKTPTPTATPLPANLEIAYLVYEGDDERIAITNNGGQAQVMTGWKIHSVVGDQWYYFPSGYTLVAGATVRVHSGPDAISNPPGDLLWTHNNIWNNAGDKAVLYNSAGQQVDSYCYKAGCP